MGLAVGLMSVSAAAQAATLSIDGTFAISGTAFQEPGLVVQTYPSSGQIQTTLQEGVAQTFALFDIWTDETWVNPDDRIPQSLDVDFVFTSPTTAGLSSGATVGRGFVFQHGHLTWSNPLDISYGGAEPGVLSISLSDVAFSWGFFGLTPGEKYGGTAYATISYLASPLAAVPLPGSFVLAATGILVFCALGFVGTRSRRQEDRESLGAAA